GQRRAALEAALAADPDSRELQVLLANEAARARDWGALQAQLKRLSQRGWAEDALRMRHVDLSGWEGELRLRTLLEDTWGPERARQLLLTRGFRDCAEAYCPDLVGIPAGAFLMGSPAGEPGRKADEGPQHPVGLAGFAMSRTEVTQKQWRALMGSNPSAFPACSGNGDDCPVEQVSWAEAQAFVRKLSETTGKAYRLPSEAEWEYAARAGSTTPFISGTTITALQANFDDSATTQDGQPGKKLERTTAVASYGANGFGLFDMAGNVWEWTEDCWHPNYEGAPQDGSAWTSGGNCAARVARGGGWHNAGAGLRSALRSETKSGEKLRAVGFRVVRVPQP
ncbi:MAG TPA: formylglycine-generating enzyme family protein, partial [Roseateles sp.]|nr:formylglycine-generating enzyme family protein [Roseateles sp.]